jgi:hypothetical protein
MSTNDSGSEVLDRAACLALLSTTDRARIAIHVGALPRILPVRFVVDLDRLVLRVANEPAVVHATDGTVVAFEAGVFDALTGEEWSVGVLGVARHNLDPADLAYLEALAIPDGDPTRPHRVITVTTTHVGGHRVRRSVSPAPAPST